MLCTQAADGPCCTLEQWISSWEIAEPDAHLPPSLMVAMDAATMPDDVSELRTMFGEASSMSASSTKLTALESTASGTLIDLHIIRAHGPALAIGTPGQLHSEHSWPYITGFWNGVPEQRPLGRAAGCCPDGNDAGRVQQVDRRQTDASSGCMHQDPAPHATCGFNSVCMC